MTQLLKLQELLFQDACSEESKGKRFLSSRAWKELQELRLRLQMKAPPRPVDVAELERIKQKAKERREAGQIDYRKRRPAEPSAPNVTPMPQPTPEIGTKTGE